MIISDNTPEYLRMLHSPMNGSARPGWEVFSVCVEDRGSCFLARALVEGRKEGWPAYEDKWAILMESDQQPNSIEALKGLCDKLRTTIPRAKDGST
jgi:hypothetical protein